MITLVGTDVFLYVGRLYFCADSSVVRSPEGNKPLYEPPEDAELLRSTLPVLSVQ